MASFTDTILKRTVFGDKKVILGKFVNAGGSTGGDIATGLTVVDQVILQHVGSAVVASAPVVNETLPLSSGDVTIVTVANTSGTFMAIGN